MAIGLSAAALSYVLWGLFPLYFHALLGMDAFEIILHRSLWSFVFVWLLLLAMRRWQWLPRIAADPGAWGRFLASALFLSTNWLLYVWAVNHGHVIEASLGYFINPLVNVLLGTAVLGERPRRGQWIAIAVAAAGVLWLTVTVGRPPWIALGLACSFGLYGLLRKTAPLGALEGLAMETLVILPVAVAALAWLTLPRGGPFGGMDTSRIALLLAAGPITAIPLLLFAYGARRISLGTLGVMQYIAPSIQFALGRWWFGEPLQASRLAGFALIWIALALYSVEGLVSYRRSRLAPTLPVGAGAGAAAD
jgi:chloramphenicol-sensitive protein RarD